MPKKTHPADAFDASVIAEAVSFNVHVRLSPSAKINETAPTLAEAVILRDRLQVAHPARTPLVYAINAAGRQALIPKETLTAHRSGDFDPIAAAPTAPEKREKPKVKGNAPKAAKPRQKADTGPTKAIPAPSEATAATIGKRAALIEAAKAGTIPAAPDFSAPTHARFRKKLDELRALVDAGDVKALKAYPINPISSSPKALDRYRNLAVIALEANAAA